MVSRLLFGKSRSERGMVVLLVLLGALAAFVFNSEEFRRYMRMRSM